MQQANRQARPKWGRTLLGLLGALTLLIGAIYCANEPTPPKQRVMRITAPALARAQAARTRMAWVGEFHQELIADFKAHKDAWLGNARSRASDCAAAVRVATKYAAVAKAKLGYTAALTVPAGVLNSVGCPESNAARGVPLMLLWRQGLIVDSASIYDPNTAYVTGAFDSYTGALSAVYGYATTPDQVASATWAVVDQAAADGLDAPDLDVLAGLASLSVSSAYQWYGYQQQGYIIDTSAPTTYLDPATPIAAIGFWGKLGVVDLGGALMGARGGMGAGPAGAFYGALIGGGIASAVWGIVNG